jgi:acid phosphatase family membrane protein YuiD
MDPVITSADPAIPAEAAVPGDCRCLDKRYTSGKNKRFMNRLTSDSLYRMLQSPVFLSAVFSWLIAQTIKSIIEIIRNKPSSAKVIFLHLFWSTGGMPSSHTAVVTALAASIGFVVGIDSPLFILALFFAFLTIRDALGVRRAAGSQAIVLNQLIRDLSRRFDLETRPVKEIRGHKASEVSVGILLGFFIAAAFSSL